MERLGSPGVGFVVTRLAAIAGAASGRLRGAASGRLRGAADLVGRIPPSVTIDALQPSAIRGAGPSASAEPVPEAIRVHVPGRPRDR